MVVESSTRYGFKVATEVYVAVGVAVCSGVRLGIKVGLVVMVGMSVTVGAERVRSAAKVEMAAVWTAPRSTGVEVSVGEERLHPNKRTVEMIIIMLLRT
jgi:hypothetical protein